MTTQAKNANGAKTKPINVWKSQEIAPPETVLKILLTIPFNRAIIAMYPINIAPTMTATSIHLKYILLAFRRMIVVFLQFLN